MKKFGDLIDLHIDDTKAVGKAPRRSRAASLEILKRELGKCNIATLDREQLIRFGRERSQRGCSNGRTRIALCWRVSLAIPGDGGMCERR